VDLRPPSEVEIDTLTGGASDLLKLGALHREAGRVEEAERCYRRALEALEVPADSEDPEMRAQRLSSMATVRHNLAVLCEATGRAEEATALWAGANALLDGLESTAP